MKIGRLQSSLGTETKNLLAVLQLAILGVQALSLLTLFIMAAKLGEVANRRPTFAQLVNGQTVYVSEQDRQWRYPEVVRKFVSDWTLLTFNWEGQLAGTTQSDPGIEAGDTKRRVPTNTWFASTMMEPKFATAFLPTLAELVPPEVFSGKLRSITTIQYLSDPRQIAPGKWEVDMLSTRIVIDRETGQSDRIAFNRRFTVQTTEIPQSPLGNEASAVEKKIYELQAAGLEITNIVPYDPNQ
jgi:hypothetical protein